MRSPRTRPVASVSRAPFQAGVLEIVDDDHVLLRALGAPTAEVQRAELAVPGYAAEAGDRVLVTPIDDDLFVTGALGDARRRLMAGLAVARRADGVTELRVADGDLALSAPGRILLRAAAVDTEADSIRARASEIATAVGRLEVNATRIVERAGDTYRHVEGLAELQAGHARTLVEGALHLAAQRTTIQSDEDTVVDGERVLLG